VALVPREARGQPIAWTESKTRSSVTNDADDVILAEINAGLDLDQLQHDLAFNPLASLCRDTWISLGWLVGSTIKRVVAGSNYHEFVPSRLLKTRDRTAFFDAHPIALSFLTFDHQTLRLIA
jgi:hypothetical protein